MSTRRSVRLSGAAAAPAAPEIGNTFEPSEIVASSVPDMVIAGLEEAESEDEYGMSEEEKPYRRRSRTTKVISSLKSDTSVASAIMKLSAPAKAKPAIRSRVQGRLKNIMSMPLDVLFEIFSALLPADLLSLARTSKNIRQVLMNRNHSGLWKAARANAPGLPSPDPPVDMSEPAWSRLLYGGSGCYSCNAKNVQRIDFGLRRRACVNCKKAFLVWKSRFKSVCAGMDAGLMDLVGYTNVSAHSHGHGSKNRYYWKPDLVGMERRLGDLGKGKDGAIAVREFRTRKKAEVSESMKGVSSLEIWVSEAEVYKLQERTSARDENYKSAVSRLTAAGYEGRDIPDWGVRNMLHGKPVLNESAWKRLFPKIESITISSREARLAREARLRVGQRSRIAAWLYRDYLHTLVPVQWRYLPAPEHLVRNYCRDIPSFRRLVLSEDALREEEWSEAVASLPEDLSAYLVSRLAPIAQTLPGLDNCPTSFELAFASEGSDRAALDTVYARLAPLDLAKAVLRWDGLVYTTGADNIHFQDGRESYNFQQFCPQGASAVDSIIRLIGDVPSAATATDLDKACGDTWFGCVTCSAGPGMVRYFYFGWRTYLQHCITFLHTDHQPETIQAGDLNHNPRSAKYDSGHRRWACTHCHAYSTNFSSHEWHTHDATQSRAAFVSGSGRVFSAFGCYEELIQHNQREHDIANPEEHYDFFYYTAPGGVHPTKQIQT